MVVNKVDERTKANGGTGRNSILLGVYIHLVTGIIGES